MPYYCTTITWKFLVLQPNTIFKCRLLINDLLIIYTFFIINYLLCSDIIKNIIDGLLVVHCYALRDFW